MESHSGWRLDFVVTSSRRSKLAYQREQLLDVQELQRRILLAEKLSAEGLRDPAMLMLWSAIEGALRRSAVFAGIPFESFDSVALLKQLHFQGLLYDDLRVCFSSHAEQRHECIHFQLVLMFVA